MQDDDQVALRFGQELKVVPLSMIAKEVCMQGRGPGSGGSPQGGDSHD